MKLLSLGVLSQVIQSFGQPAGTEGYVSMFGATPPEPNGKGPPVKRLGFGILPLRVEKSSKVVIARRRLGVTLSKCLESNRQARRRMGSASPSFPCCERFNARLL